MGYTEDQIREIVSGKRILPRANLQFAAPSHPAQVPPLAVSTATLGALRLESDPGGH
jgi:hypothetical protein